MNIKAKFKYGYQMEELVTIIDIYSVRGVLWAIFVNGDGLIYEDEVDRFEVIDQEILPTKGRK